MKPIERRCPKCGTTFDPSMNVCPSCGRSATSGLTVLWAVLLAVIGLPVGLMGACFLFFGSTTGRNGDLGLLLIGVALLLVPAVLLALLIWRRK